MADNLKERGPQDRSRIDVNEEWEVRYWCEKFGCTPDELRVAVDAVGVSVDDVKTYLGK